jgi:hypothetical protein
LALTLKNLATRLSQIQPSLALSNSLEDYSKNRRQHNYLSLGNVAEKFRSRKPRGFQQANGAKAKTPKFLKIVLGNFKKSKIVRTEHQFVSHGDFRRYLYEAMVIPMGSLKTLEKRHLFKAVFVFKAQIGRFGFRPDTKNHAVFWGLQNSTIVRAKTQTFNKYGP